MADGRHLGSQDVLKLVLFLAQVRTYLEDPHRAAEQGLHPWPLAVMVQNWIDFIDPPEEEIEEI
jgi:hypothetical protein